MNKKSIRHLYILAIETSCDDTSIALLKDDQVLGMKSASSLTKYPKYGGIIPEIAARSHEEMIDQLYRELLASLKFDFHQITHVAYTSEPGLPGSLHIGKIYAKTLGFLLSVPVIPINHLHAHAMSFAINNYGSIRYPFLALVASGGNTVIYFCTNPKKFTIVNETGDDAVGEALDKIGRALGLTYPGAIAIDRNYQKTKVVETIKHLPPDHPFSFSGIKVHCLNWINQAKQQKQHVDTIKIGSSALHWAVDDILLKLQFYADQYHLNRFAFGGGFIANQLFRKKIAAKKQWESHLTDLAYVGDNAAMIGFLAYCIIKK